MMWINCAPRIGGLRSGGEKLSLVGAREEPQRKAMH